MACPPRDRVKPKVLVVDDDDANLRTFRIVFRDEYDIGLALSGEEALGAVEADAFDVALVDYAMPGMNGLEVLRRMQASRPAVRRAIVSGYPDLPDIAAASRSGLAAAVVTKPWDRAALQRIIAELAGTIPAPSVSPDGSVERAPTDAAARGRR